MVIAPNRPIIAELKIEMRLRLMLARPLRYALAISDPTEPSY